MSTPNQPRPAAASQADSVLDAEGDAAKTAATVAVAGAVKAGEEGNGRKPEPQTSAATLASPNAPAKKKRGPYKHKGTRRLAAWERRRKAERERRCRAAAKAERKIGRPSAYKDEFAEQGRKLASVGLNDTEIMEFFEISPPTFYGWLKKHPEFLNEIRRGRTIAGAHVAHALYRRAIGYSYESVHIHVGKNGKVVQTLYTKHYPPDIRACIFWLTNRDPEHWGKKVEPQGPGGQPIAPLIICVSSEEMPVAKAALTAPKSDGQIATPREAAVSALAVPSGLPDDHNDSS
jgi:hypothetical protein